MPTYGYKISSEEHGPQDLVRHAARAEEAGFTFAAISDHIHPWTDKQGHSPFVWGVLGAISQVTEKLELLTGVTAPIIRMHPAIVAHAAATAYQLLPGRFSLGVGTGEHLNEHVLGDKWPRIGVRRAMLEEAMEVMRKLWEGDNTNFSGEYYTVENARIYDAPDETIPIIVAASGDKALELAGEKGDGLISLSPDEDNIETFEQAGGRGKPKYAEVQVCWAESDAEALDTAIEWWPNMAAPGELSQELPLPRHFEQVAGKASKEDLEPKLAYGPDPERHLKMIRKYTEAGYTHVWMHQIGPDQEGFFNFYESKILPALRT
jgi:coenzyme F420-dependent glucose-6-phosphate dehydrogenase